MGSPAAHGSQCELCWQVAQRFLDRLLQRCCLSLCPCCFECCHRGRVQLPTYLSDLVVQGISIETGGQRQVVSSPKQPAGTLYLYLDSGDLSQANQSYENAHPIFHALQVLPET